MISYDKEKLQNLLDKAEKDNGNSASSSGQKHQWYKPSGYDIETSVRIVNQKPEELPFATGHYHNFKGVGKKGFIQFTCPTTFESDCLICSLSWDMYNKCKEAQDAGVERNVTDILYNGFLMTKNAPKTFSLVIDRKDNNAFKYWSYSNSVLDEILTSLQSADYTDEDVFSLPKGFDWRVKRTKQTNGFDKINVNLARESTKAVSSEKEINVMNSMPDIREMIRLTPADFFGNMLKHTEKIYRRTLNHFLKTVEGTFEFESEFLITLDAPSYGSSYQDRKTSLMGDDSSSASSSHNSGDNITSDAVAASSNASVSEKEPEEDKDIDDFLNSLDK